MNLQGYSRGRRAVFETLDPALHNLDLAAQVRELRLSFAASRFRSRDWMEIHELPGDVLAADGVGRVTSSRAPSDSGDGTEKTRSAEVV